jgi:uncharacterized protein
MHNISNIAPNGRIGSLDVTRGVAVLGIFLLNITGFALPFAYEDPTNSGGAAGLNLFVWRINSLLFEGTMRGLFTILFGASALLFLERAARRSGEPRPTKFYFRRMMWLIVFGLINGYLLLWDGDILFYYGIVGSLLFLFRNLGARALLIAAATVLLLQWTVTFYEYRSYEELSTQAHQIETLQSKGVRITADQWRILRDYEKQQQDFKPGEMQVQAAVDAMRASYATAFDYVRGRTFYVQTVFFLEHGIGDALSLMLLGMALFKLGLLTGEARSGVYKSLALIGYAVGLTVNSYEVLRLERAHFSVDAFMAAYLTYDLGRLAMTLGHLGLILFVYQTTASARAKSALAAVGKMALTNYLAQSLICLLLFTGVGLALYGQLERHQLYYIVAIVWALQLWWSSLWLQHFRYGPMEWLWRKLTYGSS